jgi:hypothetical protein
MKRLAIMGLCLVSLLGASTAEAWRGVIGGDRVSTYGYRHAGWYVGRYGVYPYGYDHLSGHGVENIGNRPAGPYTICSPGRVADLPVEDQIFWHDGETTYGPKYAGQRCIHQQ